MLGKISEILGSDDNQKSFYKQSSLYLHKGSLDETYG